MTYLRLDNLRKRYKPQYPQILNTLPQLLTSIDTPSIDDTITSCFPFSENLPILNFQENAKLNQACSPINVGVLLSGGQAPGGHNVITGIFDYIKEYNESSKLYGFLMGVGGLLKGEYRELTSEIIDSFRNSGGFDMLGADRTKIETKEHFDIVLSLAKSLSLDALIVIGGDDSNTNAALFSEYLISQKENLAVIGCPKTIDGDLKNKWIETSFGFDTCSKVFGELIGNIQRDCFSSKKYWHFIKLMGRSASHLTLECALMTQPTFSIISEEVAAKNLSIKDIINELADLVINRSKKGLNYGVILIPEGLIEFLPKMKKLIRELNYILAKEQEHLLIIKRTQLINYLASRLTKDSADFFLSLPKENALQLASERDPHGNIQVSKIKTEELLVKMLKSELKRRAQKGEYKEKFSSLTHFFGYEGRCSIPSNFDASYCYALGRVASILAIHKKQGYMTSIKNLTQHPLEWVPIGVPFIQLMKLEERKGILKPVIEKSLVNLKGEPFSFFQKERTKWQERDCFRYPGPIQYFGPSAICDTTTITLRLEHNLSIEEKITEA